MNLFTIKKIIEDNSVKDITEFLDGSAAHALSYALQTEGLL